MANLPQLKRDLVKASDPLGEGSRWDEIDTFTLDRESVDALFEVQDALMEFFENEDPEGVRGEIARLYNKAGLVLLKHGLIDSPDDSKGNQAK